MKFMMTYSLMWSSFESFSMDTNNMDVKNDGYYSMSAKIIVDYAIGFYRNGNFDKLVLPYSEATQTQKTFINFPRRVLCF